MPDQSISGLKKVFDMPARHEEAFAMWRRMGLESRTANALIANDILTVKQLRALSFSELCYIKMLGPLGLRTIQNLLYPDISALFYFSLLPPTQMCCADEWIKRLGKEQFSNLIDQISSIVEEHFVPEQQALAIHTLGAIVRHKARVETKWGT